MRVQRGRFRKLFGLALTLALLMLGAACAGSTPAPGTPASSPGVAARETLPAAPAAATKAPWQEDWERTLAAAKREGKVIVTVFDATTRRGVERLSETFPEIQVEGTILPGNEFTVRVPEERRAGIHVYDVYMSGPVSAVNNLLPLGERTGQPVLGDTRSLLIRPDVIEDSNWIGGFDDFWGDDETKRIISFHPRATPGGTSLLVNRQKLPAEKFGKLEDLFLPELKGKWCAADPRLPGAGPTFFTQTKMIRGEQFVRRLFTETRLVLSRDRRALAEALVRGDFWACVGADIRPLWEQGVGTHVVSVRLEQGARIAPEYLGKVKITCCGTGKQQQEIEGFYSSGLGGPAIINNAPHPNAAKLFINWLLTKEGQTAFHAPLFRDCSARLDMQDKCSERPLLESGKAWIDIQHRTNASHWQETINLAIQVFGR
jgi:hypothetical protein